MDKEILNYVIEKTQELMSASSCSSEAKKAAQTWLDAIGSEEETAETKKYIEELEAAVTTIDNLISFAESDHGIQVFGADTAKAIATHAKEIKSYGEKYCDCPACAAAVAIIEKKDNFLK
ncbi:molecular chaperone Hsp90 [Candidatus Clostridium stratigraminis]|uniref:Molecular chaperone Hsp90 n=1 Tax=Candidatus Clostridium stratigraminis TaxID=3381661 RepID=A0ABW8T8S1_9CLOT